MLLIAGGRFFNPLKLEIKQIANTNVLHWAGRLFALHEVQHLFHCNCLACIPCSWLLAFRIFLWMLCTSSQTAAHVSVHMQRAPHRAYGWGAKSQSQDSYLLLFNECHMRRGISHGSWTAPYTQWGAQIWPGLWVRWASPTSGPTSACSQKMTAPSASWAPASMRRCGRGTSLFLSTMSIWSFCTAPQLSCRWVFSSPLLGWSALQASLIIWLRQLLLDSKLHMSLWPLLSTCITRATGYPPFQHGQDYTRSSIALQYPVSVPMWLPSQQHKSGRARIRMLRLN